jgi:hypothetical protein
MSPTSSGSKNEASKKPTWSKWEEGLFLLLASSRYIPEYRSLHNHRCENLRSYINTTCIGAVFYCVLKLFWVVSKILCAFIFLHEHIPVLVCTQLHYGLRFTANQFFSDPSPLRLTTSIFLTEHFQLQSLCNILSDERMGPWFTIVAGPRQRSHSLVRVPQDSGPYFTVSDSRLPQPGGRGPRIHSPQEHGGPVILPTTGFPFGRLLRLAGLRWRY